MLAVQNTPAIIAQRPSLRVSLISTLEEIVATSPDPVSVGIALKLRSFLKR